MTMRYTTLLPQAIMVTIFVIFPFLTNGAELYSTTHSLSSLNDSNNDVVVERAKATSLRIRREYIGDDDESSKQRRKRELNEKDKDKKDKKDNKDKKDKKDKNNPDEYEKKEGETDEMIIDLDFMIVEGDRGFSFSKQADVVENHDCVMFGSNGLDSASGDEECVNNNCPGGCCRKYNWLICDENNEDYNILPCICNANTNNTHIPPKITTNTTSILPEVPIENPATETPTTLSPTTAMPATANPTNMPSANPPQLQPTNPPTLQPTSSPTLLPTLPPTNPPTNPPSQGDPGRARCTNQLFGPFIMASTSVSSCTFAEDCPIQGECCLKSFCACGKTTQPGNCLSDTTTTTTTTGSITVTTDITEQLPLINKLADENNSALTAKQFDTTETQNNEQEQQIHFGPSACSAGSIFHEATGVSKCFKAEDCKYPGHCCIAQFCICGESTDKCIPDY